MDFLNPYRTLFLIVLTRGWFAGNNWHLLQLWWGSLFFTFCATRLYGAINRDSLKEMYHMNLNGGLVRFRLAWALLVDIPIPNVTGEIANFLLHLLVPLGLLIDWLVVGDPMTKPSWKILIAWLIFPLTFVIYTEVRGPFAHFYPYFFLDPQAMGGVGNLVLSIIGMMIVFLVVASLIFWLYRKRGSIQIQIVPASSVSPLVKRS